MKHRIIAGVAAAAIATVGLLAVAAPASADSYGGEVCTPAAAWTEVVEVPAVGEPTLTVENPDYVPAVPAVTKVVTHPAETQVVNHEAEGYTEYHFAKFTRERTRTLSIYGWGAWSDYGSWSKYSPETHTSWETSTNALGSPQWHSAGDRNWGTVQWERQWQAQYDGQSRWVETKAAWSETVITKPAWDETVVVTPEVPAVGEPTKTIDNPDYVPASTRNVEHEAVTCPTPPVTEEPEVPTTPTTPVVTPAAPLTPAAAPVKAAAASDDTLAQTGDGSSRGLIGFASLLLIAGLGVLGIRRIVRH